MGAASSKKHDTEEFRNVCSSCSAEELASLKRTFVTFAGGETEILRYIDLKDHVRILTQDVVRHLYAEMCSASRRVSEMKDSDAPVATLGGFIATMVQYMKGDSDQLANGTIWLVLGRDADGDANCSRNDWTVVCQCSKRGVADVLVALIRAYCCVEAAHPISSKYNLNADPQPSEDRLMRWLMDELKTEDPELCTTEELRRWMDNTGIVVALYRSVFHRIAGVEINRNLLQCGLPDNLSELGRHDRLLLDIPTIFFLSQHLNPNHRSEWKLLYSSYKQGESFSRLENHVNGRGPCIVILRTEETSLVDGADVPHVFGGYADQGFRTGSAFTGSTYSFLFSISPTMQIYNATGYNQNYCYLNVAQQTVPNGLGMGGFFEMADAGGVKHYFGLWLDSEFGRGESNAKCSTFGNKRLSVHPDYTSHQIEVWSVDPKSDKEPPKRPSVLDRDPEVKALLAMTNKGPVSEGLRDTDENADSPDEHTLHHEHFRDFK